MRDERVKSECEKEIVRKEYGNGESGGYLVMRSLMTAFPSKSSKIKESRERERERERENERSFNIKRGRITSHRNVHVCCCGEPDDLRRQKARKENGKRKRIKEIKCVRYVYLCDKERGERREKRRERPLSV